VGAGAAGILLSVKLSRRGQRVLLLESGHFEADESRQQLNAIEQTAKSLSNANWTRKRIIGGTTTAWGGQSLPFSQLDFADRDWVKFSGWPITHAALKKYYSEADRFMGLDGRDFDSGIKPRLGGELPDFDPRKIRMEFSKWAPEPNFLKKYRRVLRKRVVLLFNAHLNRIDTEEETIQSIEVANFRGGKIQIRARQVVIAAGGIESTRILLLNDHQNQGGLGNQSKMLGKGFMEHPCMRIGDIKPYDEKKLHAALGNRVRFLRKYSPKLSASADWQRQYKRVNVSAGIVWSFDDPASDPMSALASAIRNRSIQSMHAAVQDLPHIAIGLKTLLLEGFIFKSGSRPSVAMVAEQPPSKSSFIALSKAETDMFGKRLAVLEWNIPKETWNSMIDFGFTLRDELERTGLGRLSLLEHVRYDEPDWERHLSDVNHHMGGTRMSSEFDRGVVDTNLRVWGTSNLYVCSASVFPTGSHSNPTLTVLALAARLADHLLSKKPKI
jgi:choline dehydrogenase-like flavoprotein